MSTYNDKNLKLNNIALTQFEMAREIPAALDLFAKKPQSLDMQTRMLILKVNAAIHNLKSKNKLTLAVGIDFLSFLNPMIAFLHGDKKDRLETLSLSPQEHLKETKLQKELDLLIDKANIFSSDIEVISNAIKKDSLLIAILNATSINPARECIDAFSTGKEGLLLIHNYSIEQSPSHHLYAVERGLRILENPDGSGECYSL
ncbi:MAG: hypothetical protein EVA26_03690 [Burkholderiaceae bacterium]|nr:MAG: hypothetical protein EVA26_03690 [Burkholderiaceae bacterium]|tara:strand:- start:27 stop:632 length:606 start_codon:yes stop_codon:yes gene_type:complete